MRINGNGNGNGNRMDVCGMGRDGIVSRSNITAIRGENIAMFDNLF